MRIIGHKLSFSTVLLHNPKPIHVCNKYNQESPRISSFNENTDIFSATYSRTVKCKILVMIIVIMCTLVNVEVTLSVSQCLQNSLFVIRDIFQCHM